MTTDRQLLEDAARAAGMELGPVGQEIGSAHFDGEGLCKYHSGGFVSWRWRPLTDDGDAFRLAVKLRLQVTPGTYNKEEATAYSAGVAEAHEKVHYQQDLEAATRRAIVRAAAAIGRQKEAGNG